MPLMRWLRREKSNNRNGFPAPFAALSEPPTADYRGMPTYVCACGYDMFLMAARFDETQLPAMYLLDGMCAHCGALVTLPCPADGVDPLAVNDHV